MTMTLVGPALCITAIATALALAHVLRSLSGVGDQAEVVARA